nr:hypothetical protein [Tanacetum cinerariifolium]
MAGWLGTSVGDNRKHFKTLSLDESRSPDFDLLYNQEECLEEEVAETMAETIEQYMSKTQADYGSGIARPKIKDKDSFELKGQFLKELRDNTFRGSDHEDANEHIEKVFKIVDLFHIPNITIDQVMHRAFPMSLTGAYDVSNVKVPITPKIFHSRKKGKPWKKLTTYNLVYLFKENAIEQQLWDSIKGTTHEESSNLIKEIRASTGAAIRNQGASIKTLKIQIGQMSKVLQEKGFGSLPSSTETNPSDHVKSISTIVEVDVYLIRRASVSVMPLSTYLNLGLDELSHTKLTVELAYRNVKYPKGIAENVLVEARLIGETLVLNRSLDPFFEDYMELNDFNIPLELRRDQVDDLMPTIEECEVVEEFKARNDARMVSKILDILVIATTIKRSV